MYQGVVQNLGSMTIDPPPVRVQSVPRRAIAVLSWVYLLIVGGLWIGLRIAEDRWWPASVLLYVPSWLFAVPLALLVPAALTLRRWLLLTVPAAALIVAFPIMGLKFSPARLFANDATSPAIRLLTCNVHRNQLNAAALAEVIRSSHPDVVALQDWTDRHVDQLFGDGGWYVRREGELCLASRYPIGAVDVLEIRDPQDNSPRDSQGSAARYEIQTPRGVVYVINVHLASPHLGFNELLRDGGAALRANLVRRRYESRALRTLVDQTTENLLIAGDFNTTENGLIYRESWSSLTNAFSETGMGFGHTYFNKHTTLRIDHVLAGEGWTARRCWVGPAVGSPHRPLIADFD